MTNITNALRGLSTLGKDLVDTQKTEWLADAETRLQTLANETTAKLHRTALTAAGIIAGGLVILAGAIIFN